MKHFRVIAAVLICSCLFGCTLVMQDDGTLEAGIATTLTLKQTGPKDVGRESRIGVEFEDWFQDFLIRTFPEYFGIDSDGDGVADQSVEPDVATE